MLAAFGASYYTLKLVGYLVDVFWRRYPPWDDAVKFGLFATFFPLLPAGPIQRAGEFALPRDNEQIAELMAYGLRRILLGLVKKLLVADRLGDLVDYIAGGQPGHADLLWVMAYLFPLQLYVDFSALTDIGIGVAAIFGIRAPENFAFPFFASSISEFWRRWHMSLTRWLRRLRLYALAHGDPKSREQGACHQYCGEHAAHRHVARHQLRMAAVRADQRGLSGRRCAYAKVAAACVQNRRPWMERWASVLGPVLVFHMIAFSLVCFRAQRLPDIAYFFGNLFTGLNAPVAGLKELFYSYGRGRCAYDFAALCAFTLLEGTLYMRSRQWGPLAGLPRFVELPRAARWCAYYAALLAVGIASQQTSRFIYVQF